MMIILVLESSATSSKQANRILVAVGFQHTYKAPRSWQEALNHIDCTTARFQSLLNTVPLLIKSCGQTTNPHNTPFVNPETSPANTVYLKRKTQEKSCYCKPLLEPYRTL